MRSQFFLGYTIGGEEFVIESERWPAVPEDLEFAKNFMIVAEQLLLDGKIKPHPADVRHGIENILSGMQEMKEGKHSGVKLVYRIGSSD